MKKLDNRLPVPEYNYLQHSQRRQIHFLQIECPCFYNIQGLPWYRADRTLKGQKELSQ